MRRCGWPLLACAAAALGSPAGAARRLEDFFQRSERWGRHGNLPSGEQVWQNPLGWCRLELACCCSSSRHWCLPAASVEDCLISCLPGQAGCARMQDGKACTLQPDYDAGLQIRAAFYDIVNIRKRWMANLMKYRTTAKCSKGLPKLRVTQIGQRSICTICFLYLV